MTAAEAVKGLSFEKVWARKLAGAGAGEIVVENVLKYAFKKRLHVLVPGGIDCPGGTAGGFKVREW